MIGPTGGWLPGMMARYWVAGSRGNRLQVHSQKDASQGNRIKFLEKLSKTSIYHSGAMREAEHFGALIRVNFPEVQCWCDASVLVRGLRCRRAIDDRPAILIVPCRVSLRLLVHLVGAVCAGNACLLGLHWKEVLRCCVLWGD